MMSHEPMVSICGLSKQYIRRSRSPGLIDYFRDPLFWFQTVKGTPFLALDNISVEVEKGSAVALIGPNGAGKSSLLRILARVSEPTSGYVDLHGSVGSLLDLGVGFHPELSGRENIYLGGSFLGMTRREVQQNFDEIVEFSGLAHQLETPVRFYSTGQYMRLGFAVAAFLRNDIILLDEVLAVGDMEFQKKCMDKVAQLVSSGRTAIVVSHNFSMASTLCNRGIYLRSGKLQCTGDFRTVLNRYINDSSQKELSTQGETKLEDCARILKATLAGTADTSLVSGQDLLFEIDLQGGPLRAEFNLVICILNAKRNVVLSVVSSASFILKPGERVAVTMRITDCSLVPGVYTAKLSLLPVSDTAVDTNSTVIDPAFNIVADERFSWLVSNSEIDGLIKYAPLSAAKGTERF